MFVILNSALCDTLTGEIQWKNNQRKRNSESHMSQNVNGMFYLLGKYD